VHWVTPARGLRPKRVDILGEFLAEKLGRGTPKKGRGK
jgi:hypothetical protein